MHHWKMWTHIIVFVCLIAPAVAAEKKSDRVLPTEYAELLAKAEQLELISLNPRKPRDKEEKLYGFVVLGRTTLKGDDRSVAVEAMHRAYAEGNPKFGFFCFQPRHCIRAKIGGRTVDFLLCFACSNMRVHEAGRETAHHVIGGGKETQAPLDGILKSAKIPLPEENE